MYYLDGIAHLHKLESLLAEAERVGTDPSAGTVARLHAAGAALMLRALCADLRAGIRAAAREGARAPD